MQFNHNAHLGCWLVNGGSVAHMNALAVNQLSLVEQGDSREADLARELLRQYGVGGTEYTAYPGVERFAEFFDGAALARAIATRAPLAALQPLSLDVRVPFCESQCVQCTRQTVVGRSRAAVEPYLTAMGRELDILEPLLGRSPTVSQMQLGGGTPNFLTAEQLEQLVRRVRECFNFAAQGDYLIEIDPSRFADEEIRAMASLGFNRMNLGLQDFHPKVQVAVNRIQFEDRTAAVMQTAKAAGFRSVGVELWYGLPTQTREAFSFSLQRLVDLNPDRISLLRYRHDPLRFPTQRAFRRDVLPDRAACVDMMLEARSRLGTAGYVDVGLDLFVRADEDLAIAMRRGRLQRNSWGYSSQTEHDRIGLGLGAISRIGHSYAQNLHALDAYHDRLEQGVLPVMRGIELSRDDLVRHAVIRALLGRGEISIESIEIAYLVNFRSHFADECQQLETMAKAGLLELTPEWITLTPDGRLVVRAVCAVFDRYRQTGSQAPVFGMVTD